MADYENSHLSCQFDYERLTVALLAGSAAAQPAQPAESSVTLKDALRDRFKIGAAINRTIATGASVRADNVDRTLEQVQADAAHIIKQFNQISPENDLKWQLIHPTAGPDGYNWDPADAYVNFGVTNKMYIVGHTLVWHGQTPNWVFQGNSPPPVEDPNAGGARRGRGIGFSGPRRLAKSCWSGCGITFTRLSAVIRGRSKLGMSSTSACRRWRRRASKFALAANHWARFHC